MLLPQKCPDGQNALPDGTCPPPVTTAPGDTGGIPPLPGDTGGDQGTNCTMPDGTGGIRAPSGNCVPYGTDIGNGNGTQQGCEFGGGTWDPVTQTCAPPAAPTNPWDTGGGTPCTQPDGSPGKLAPSGNCVPIDYKPDQREGCEFSGGRWNEQTQSCERRGENNCFPGEVFHPFAGCVPDTGQGIPDPNEPPTPPENYQPCTDPNGQPGWIAPSGNCMGLGGTLPPPTDGYAPPPSLDIPGSPLPEVPEDILGQDPVNVDPDAFDFDEYQGYIDTAFENKLRAIEPQEQLERERFAQELINRGIDPYSAAGQKALKQMQMGQNDRRNSAYAEAQQMGIDMQNQMWNQGFGEAGLANNLASIVMQLRQQGHEFDVMALLKGDEQAWKQFSDVVGWNRQDYYDWWDRVKYNDAVAFGFAGYGPTPGYNSSSISSPFGVNPNQATGGNVPWWMSS